LVTVASAVIDHATVTDNRALVEHGGGIAVAQSNLTLTNSIVVGNGLWVRTDGRDISVADAVLTAGRDVLTGTGAPRRGSGRAIDRSGLPDPRAGGRRAGRG
jgi:hypothetical protein